MTRHLATAASILALAVPAAAFAQPVEVAFLYKLSSMTGVIPFHGLNVAHDARTKETLVVGGGRVTLFNATGMEIFSFGDDPDLGSIVGAAPTEDGDFVLLSVGRSEVPDVVVANFRGEFKGRIEPKELPAQVPKPFLANAIGWAQGHVYLADLAGMRVVVLAMDGSFVAFHDLARLCDIADNKRVDFGLKGFRVAENGDVLFTVQPLFRAFVLSTDGTVKSFGVKGSAPGKFNIVTGIARDERGYYYVADILKSAVLVFDKEFRWVKEFGYRGVKPGSIFAPVDIDAGDGKVFVSQFAKKGVSVFEVKVLDAP